MASGNKFKEGRKKKGITLVNVSEKIKIPPRILQAIEEEKFAELPNPIYLKGFLKKYARFLGLDTASIVDEYLKIFPEKPKQELTLPRLQLRHSGRWPKELIFPLLLVLILILSAVAINFIKPPRRQGREQEPVKTASALGAAGPAMLKKKIPTEFSLPLELKAETLTECWIRVRVDKKVIFEKVVAKGETVSWKAKEKMELRVGRAEALRFELNGTPLEAPGKGTISILITKEGMKLID